MRAFALPGIMSHVSSCCLIVSPSATLEMGYFRIKAGENILGIEDEIVWATPGQFTILNFPCNEDGSDCGRTSITRRNIDPASIFSLIQ